MEEGEVSTRHIVITLFIFIISIIQNSEAIEKEEDAFYEGSGNTDEEYVYDNDHTMKTVTPWLGLIIFIVVILCCCGGCIAGVCICFKRCKKTSAALNEEGNPYKETEMTNQEPPTGSNANLHPVPPSGYAPVPTHSPTMPMDHKPVEKHQLSEAYGYPRDQKHIEKYQPPQPFGYPSGQQTYTPSFPHAQHGLNAIQLGYNAAQSGYGPAQSGYEPTQPGYGPAQPGYGPAQPGYGPAQPGNISAQPGYILAQPVYN